MTHPHTQYFLQTHFGLSSVPLWYKHRQRLIAALTALWNERQATYYEGRPIASCRALQKRISQSFKISYSIINHLLGVCATDPSNPYGALYDYLEQGMPKLHRSQR